MTHKTAFVKDGIIQNIDDSIVVEGMVVIDGENKFLPTGLIDMHTHVCDKQELGLYLANGVTSIRNLWRYPRHLRIKERIEENEMIGPMFFTSGPKPTSAHDLGDDKVQIKTQEETKELVIEYKRRGFDFVKTYAGIEEDIYQAVLEQSIESNISIVAHPSRELPYLDQFHIQIASLEHMEEIVQQALNYQLDSLKVESIIEKYVSTNTSFCPTLTGYYKIFEMLEGGEDVLTFGDVNYINPLIQLVDIKNQINRWASEKEINSSITKRYVASTNFIWMS